MHPTTSTTRSRTDSGGVGPHRSADAPPEETDRPDQDVGTGNQVWSSRGRRTGFRVVSVLAALYLLVMHVFGLMEVVLMWFPDRFLADTLSGSGDVQYPGGLPIHRAHFMAVGLVTWTLVPAVLVQLRKPWRRTGSMLVASVMVLASLVAFGLAGTFQEWLAEDVVHALPVLLLAALHPRARDLLRRPSFDPTMVRLAVVAAVPWAVYGLTQARLQLLDRPEDIHAGDLEHWAIALLLAVAITTTSLVGASDHDGWRLPAWTAALASILFGAHSLAFPGLASGLPTLAAIGAIGWGAVYATALLRRSRHESTAEVPLDGTAVEGAVSDDSRLGLAAGGDRDRG